MQRQVTVPDGPAIREALAETIGRTEVLLVTGGLGPTTDDITREAVADWLGLELIPDADVARAIEARFRRRGLAMSPRNARQAQRPREATVLPNAHGTAPGLYLPPLSFPGDPSGRSPHLFLLPGPPRELAPMLHEQVKPLLQKLAPCAAANQLRLLRLVGVGESLVEERIGEALLALGLELGYCARPSEVDVRLIGAADLIEQGEQIVRAAFSEGAHLVRRTLS